MFIKNPLNRLGGGMKGSKNSFEMLKSHPFFMEEKFDKIIEKIPPLNTLCSTFDIMSFERTYEQAQRYSPF
jgi:hypothetical protein